MVTRQNSEPAGQAAAAPDAVTPGGVMPEAEAPRKLTPAAERALAEAAERRARAEQQASSARELGGREGPDPVRYGDWENKGIASDF